MSSTLPHAAYVPLFALSRGDTVESVHFGAIAIVDAHGRLLASVGDPFATTYLRSTAKPFQVLPFVEDGGPEHFGLNDEELALMCASHSGTDQHVEVVQRIQQKAGVREGQLLCGTHPPYDPATAEALKARGEAPTPNRHNCSGKHTGMLAQAVLHGWPTEDYIAPEHPVQQRILAAFAEMCGLPPEKVHVGVDGCSAPNFAVPLYHAAYAYARLMDPQDVSPRRASALRAIVRAMTSHPFMVGGPGRFDTLLMEATQGRVLAKGGAEGYQGLGLPPGVLGPDSPGIGIAFKIADGDTRGAGRARPAVALEILRQLGVLREIPDSLQRFGPEVPVYNWRKLTVGQGYPTFTLPLA